MHKRIMSLGEITEPNIMNAIRAYAEMISNKSDPTQRGVVTQKIIKVLQQHDKTTIAQFKLGKLTEDEFNQVMIAALAQETAVTLSVDEFDQCWNQMHPSFALIEKNLREAIEWSGELFNQLILVSATNPKDNRYLIKQLSANGVSFETKDDALIAISGIPLVTTYVKQKSKAEIIDDLVRQHYNPNADTSTLAASLGAFIGADPLDVVEDDLLYIRGVNKENDPILKAVIDEANEKVEASLARRRVPTYLWKKYDANAPSLLDVLDMTQPESTYHMAATL